MAPGMPARIETKMATTAEAEKTQSEKTLVATETPSLRAQKLPALKTIRHGWLSRLRSYFILDPLIWAYTITLGTISLICSLFDREGRMQHALARFWSQLIMKTILSPVKVTGMKSV